MRFCRITRRRRLEEEELIFCPHILITHESCLSLLAFQINRDTPLASLHFFSTNTPSRSIPYLHYIETFFFYFTGISYQAGKLNASETRQGWNCNSGCEAPQHCTLPRCTNVVFPQTFSGSGTVSKPYTIKNYRISSNNSLERLFEGGGYFKYWSLEVGP